MHMGCHANEEISDRVCHREAPDHFSARNKYGVGVTRDNQGWIKKYLIVILFFFWQEM
jgi:hypothetical protein